MRVALRRTTTTVLAVGALLAGSLAGAAGAPAHQTVPVEPDRFYGDFEADVLLFAGVPAEDLCTDEPLPVVPGRLFDRPDGISVVKVNTSVPVFLYHSPLGAPEFVDETCGAMHDADPTTEPVSPFASGTGRLTERVEILADGRLTITNAVNGIASAPDGNSWKLRGWADFVVADGMPVGDPADFQGLTVRRIGR